MILPIVLAVAMGQTETPIEKRGDNWMFIIPYIREHGFAEVAALKKCSEIDSVSQNIDSAEICNYAKSAEEIRSDYAKGPRKQKADPVGSAAKED